MDNESGWIPPVRQWRVVVTEQPRTMSYAVTLSWRTFPCKGDEWHGHQYSQRVAGTGRIESQEDLEMILAVAVGGAWYEDVRARATAPPLRMEP